MILKFFSWTHPASHLTLFLYACLLNVILFILPELSIPTDDSFFNFWILKDTYYHHSILLPLASILSLYVQALILNRVLLIFKISPEINLLPAFIFVSLASIFPQMVLFNASSFTMFFSLVIAYNLLSIFNIEDAFRRVFFIALLIGLGTLIYPNYVFFIILLLISLPIIKNPSWREIVIIPFGFVIPFYIVGVYFYFVGDLNGFFSILEVTLPKVAFEIPVIDTWIIISLSYILILFVISYLRVLSQTENKELVKYWQIFHLFFFITLFILIATSSNKLLSGYFLLLPFSVFISNVLRKGINRRVRDILLIILIFIIIYSQLNLFPQMLK